RRGTELRSEQLAALEPAELLAVQLDAHAVRVAEVDAVEHAAVGPEVVDAGRVEPRLGLLELLGGHGDGHVLQRTDRLLVGLVIVTREVEEAEQVPVAEVEEEVARPGVVTVLDEFDEREAEQLLV